MGAGASVEEAAAKEHPAFSEEAWKAAGGSGGSLPLVRLVIPKADAKAGRLRRRAPPESRPSSRDV